MFQVDMHSHSALLNLGVSDLRAAPERFAPAVVTIPFPQMWGAQVLGYLWCWAFQDLGRKWERPGNG
jgi:hypothetical protein